MGPNFKFNPQTILAWLLLSCLGVIWGSSFLAIKISLISFQPIHVSSLRIMIGSITLLLCLTLLKKKSSIKKNARRYWTYCVGVGILSNALPFTLLAIAQEHLSSVFVGLCMATIPLVVLTLTYLLSADEQVKIQKVFGILLGVCGTTILIASKDGMSQNPFSAHQNVSVCLCVLATFCYATGAIIIRKAKPVDYLTFSTHSLLIASSICTPFLFLFGQFPADFNYNSIIAILYLGIFTTGIATLILVWLIKYQGVIFVSLGNFKVPVWSVIFGVFFLKEILPNNFMISLSLILSGVLICQFEQKKSYGSN